MKPGAREGVGWRWERCFECSTYEGYLVFKQSSRRNSLLWRMSELVGMHCKDVRIDDHSFFLVFVLYGM